jgi:hypothetical protein
MHEQFTHLTSQSQQAEAAQTERALDTFFDSISSDYGDVYGKGAMRTLPPDSTARKERLEFYRKMSALELAEQYDNRQPMERSEVLKRVLAYRHHDKIKETARKEVEQKVAARSKQSLARAAGQQTKPLTARERAMQYAAENSARLRT